jgi:hypothetical protein
MDRRLADETWGSGRKACFFVMDTSDEGTTKTLPNHESSECFMMDDRHK